MKPIGALFPCPIQHMEEAGAQHGVLASVCRTCSLAQQFRSRNVPINLDGAKPTPRQSQSSGSAGTCVPCRCDLLARAPIPAPEDKDLQRSTQHSLLQQGHPCR